MMLPYVISFKRILDLPLTSYMLLFRADYALVQDKSFKKYVQAYAADEALFFKE